MSNISYYNHYKKWHNHENPNYLFHIKRKYKSAFGEHLPQNKDTSILEIGCANGMALYTLKEMGYTNILGIEINEDLANIAKSFSIPVQNEDARNFVQSTQKKFDFIYLFDVLEHLETKQVPTLLNDLYELLNENGKLMLIVPNATSPAGTYFRYIDWTHYVSFTPTSISYLLEETGFEHIYITDESLIENPKPEDFPENKFFNQAKVRSNQARFYEAFARWQMQSMFGSSSYNMLVAPNMKVVATKHTGQDTNLIVEPESKDIFDLQQLANNVKDNGLKIEELNNTLTIKQEDLERNLNAFKKEAEVFEDKNLKDINDRVDRFYEQIKGIESDLAETKQKILANQDNLESYKSYIEKKLEEISLQNFDIINIKNTLNNNTKTLNDLRSEKSNFENLILNLYKQKATVQKNNLFKKFVWFFKQKKIKNIIRESGLFDEDYYISVNPNINEVERDPILHYLNQGAIEGRKPSESFDTIEYIKTHPDILLTGENPLIHKIKSEN